MRSSRTVARIISASLAVAVPVAYALSPRTEISNSYDFVIVGGGQAGLVLGARLSENSKHTVLVLESGGNGDEYRERIGAQTSFISWQTSLDSNNPQDTPAYSYFDSLWTTPLNWGYYTVPQPNAKNREIYWPRGKVLGGSLLRAS